MTPDEEKQLDECLEAESGLTPWELGFIENCDQNFRDRDLSERQVECLKRINGKIL